ncbi:MAG: hypothetical protein OHK0029_22450 [Armatimonadaceae bacterium]
MRAAPPSLHIEWSPNRVRLLDTATGKEAEAASLAELKGFFGGQSAAIVGVNHARVFLKTLRLPKATPDDLRRILSVQVGQIFPLPADQLAFDFHQDTDQNADGCLTLIAAMRSADLKQLGSELQQVGLRAVRVLPLSLGAAVVASRAGMPDALVMESTESGLTLDVVQGGMVRFSRLVARGSDTLCEAQRTLAAAGTDALPLLSTHGHPLDGAQATPDSALRLLPEALPFAFELEEDRARATQKRVTARTRLAALMLLSALLFVALVWADRSDALAVVKKGEGVWARELSKLRSIRDLEASRTQRVSAVQNTLKRSFEPAQPLTDLAMVVGDSLPPGAWLTGLTIERGKPLQIRGTARSAADVARYVDSLGISPRFRDVKLVFANSAKVEETPVVQFSVTATAIGNLPMPEPAKKKGKSANRTSARSSASASSTGSSAGSTEKSGSGAESEIRN